MKLSAWHKAQGDAVEWWNPLFSGYDRVYSSKVFDFTTENPYLPPDTIKGGTGYDVSSKLEPEVDAMYPDYSIYPECDYAIGYLTRGCIRNCRWCVVPEKEGALSHYRTIEQIRRPDSDKVVLMDNNVLAACNVDAILDSLIDSGLRIDFNQGLDARLVTAEVADRLARIKCLKWIRFSSDTAAQTDHIRNVTKMLTERGVAPSRIFVYFLVTADLDDAEARLEVLRELGAITIYAQAERQRDAAPNRAQLEFAQRYVYGGSWRRETWQQYCTREILD